MKRFVIWTIAAWLTSHIAAYADGDPAKGKDVFKQCASCHAIGPGAANKLGPPLNKVVGRSWGSSSNYSYSAGLLAGHKAGRIWDDAALDQWLTAPQKMIPGTKMFFGGLDDAKQRADVIAYLKGFAG